MKQPGADTQQQRIFALEVVRRIRDAGFEALWAGGCVRDDLLGRTPDDYDVATSARPEQIIELFGKRRTVAVGASFGVVMVLGARKAEGQVEVATFRADGEYLDGRRPSAVTFCSAEEDARRRDFTINGMFYDPIAEEVIDYVDGRRDLQQQIVRAIGNAEQRFREDKLRMLRAVRFAATYSFKLDSATADAVREMSAQINQVSAERIAQELRRMLANPYRAQAWRSFAALGLRSAVFPDCFREEETEFQCRVLQNLQQPTFEPSLAAVFLSLYTARESRGRRALAVVEQQCRRLKLANAETDCVCWLVAAADQCDVPQNLPLHVLKPLLADPRSPLLIDLVAAREQAAGGRTDAAAFLRSYLEATPAQTLAPPPFVSGGDVHALGIRPGPAFAKLLSQLRREQLDERITSRDEALQRLAELAQGHE